MQDVRWTSPARGDETRRSCPKSGKGEKGRGQSKFDERGQPRSGISSHGVSYTPRMGQRSQRHDASPLAMSPCYTYAGNTLPAGFDRSTHNA